MILAFSQKINDKPTYFVEKIWACLYYRFIDFDDKFYKYNQEYKEKFEGAIFVNFGITHPKRHTIRKDTSNRWKAGNDIHFCINVRTKNQFQFAPVVKCVSTQKLEIKKHPIHNVFSVYVDGIYLEPDDTELLAINDGFDSVEDFFAYFNKDFTGKIIHWTNLKY
jgi:hypothetical protein